MKTANTTQLFKIHPHTGLTDDVEFIASPNFDERPSGVLPDLIVVHGISLPPKQFGSSAITQLFNNQ
jgi:AmpD protein